MNEHEYKAFYEDVFGSVFRNKETRRLIWADRERTKKLIIMMKMSGLTDRDVADMLEVNVKTLRKHFRFELKNAKNMMVSLVSQKLFNQAMKGNVVAAMFYLKTQGRWSCARDSNLLEVEESQYGVMQVPTEKLSYDEDVRIVAES